MPEVWVPGSKEPFRPVNPWGRAMPKTPQRSRPQLYQVVVWMKREDKWVETRFGPKMERLFAEDFFRVVDEGIRLGTHPHLKNPYLVAVASEHQAQGQKTLRDLIMEKI